MPIQVPVSDTEVSTSTWGIPITNEVNRMTPLVDTHETDIAALETATATTAWSNISLNAGYQAYPGFGIPGVCKIGSLVVCRGVIQRSGANIAADTQAIFGTVPVGFRPLATLLIMSGLGSVSPIATRIEVNSAGQLTFLANATYVTNGYLMLDGLVWTVL